METDPELILEDARSLRDGMWRIDQLARDVAERLDERIEAETLDSRAEAEYVREALERMQNLSLEISEEVDAYQQRYARQAMWYVAAEQPEGG